MRVLARRERPHPGAQLSLFETAGGWRYSLWATNLPAETRGWRGQCAYADAAHRVHARVEDVIRTGKSTGLGHFPSHSYQVNQAWLDAAMTGCILLAWLKLTARAATWPEPSRRPCDTASCTPPPPGPRRTPKNPQDRRELALGGRDRHCLAARPRNPAPHLTSQNTFHRAGKETRGEVEPPATRPDGRAAVTPAP